MYENVIKKINSGTYEIEHLTLNKILNGTIGEKIAASFYGDIMYFHMQIQYICIMYVFLCQINYRIIHILEWLYIISVGCGIGKKFDIPPFGKDVLPCEKYIIRIIYVYQ